MKSIDRIPTSKLQRASKIVSTGAKVGVNYMKYYGQKISMTHAEAKENLNKNNAEDIYGGLKQLKGSALKVAQMLSMEKNLLPRAYVEKFSLAQFSVPPLSPPLVVKTFKKYFGQTPEVIFDEFDTKSVNAASIGQVHKAKKNGKRLAVKIQYPGVADSIKSDLALIKPFALKILNINAKGAEKYFKEVEEKLTEETDYCLEIEQSQQIADACSQIPNLLFPSYYREMSSNRILTMDFMKIIPMSCIFGRVSHFQRLVAWTTVPIATFVLISIVLQINKQSKREHRLRRRNVSKLIKFYVCMKTPKRPDTKINYIDVDTPQWNLYSAANPSANIKSSATNLSLR